MLNRGAILLRYKSPFIEWINTSDPCNDAPGVTLESANQDKTIYLITDNDVEHYEEWIKLNYEVLFKNELFHWYTDESLWPPKLTRNMFDEWFKVECHSILIDTVGGEIFDDET